MRGVRQIVRFNWPFYVAAVATIVAIELAGRVCRRKSPAHVVDAVTTFRQSGLRLPFSHHGWCTTGRLLADGSGLAGRWGFTRDVDQHPRGAR